MLSRFENSLRARLDEGVPSIAYGIARGDETLLLGAVGLADKSGFQATTRTPYALASVTKPMTAMAVLRLAQRGLVDLDAPVDDYLGVRLDGKAGDRRKATIRRVLDHTAGLPLHYRFYYADEDDPRPPFEDTVRRYGKLITPPGERHQYSNLGYGLLDHVIGQVSGVSFAQFMAGEVFGPLRMASASVSREPVAATAYLPSGEAYPPYVTDHPGGSEAFASVEDLLAFGRFHLLDPLGMAREPRFGYGLGWGVAERFGLRIVQHTGSMGGVSTILRMVPSLGLVIAILTNGQTELPWKAADEATALFDKTFGKGLQEPRSTPEPERLPEAACGVWSGEIEADERLPFSLEIRKGNAALARLDGQEGWVDDLAWKNGRIVGAFDGDVRNADIDSRPYRLYLDLGMRNERLEGAVVAITQVPASGQPRERRIGNALANWASLEKF